MRHGDPAQPRQRIRVSRQHPRPATLRKRIMPVLEDLPLEEKVRRGNVLLKTRPRDLEETLLQLINDDDQVIAAAAIELVRQTRSCGRSATTSSTCSRTATRTTGTSSRPPRGRWRSGGCRRERRRELWLEPLPASEIAGRLRDAAALRLGQRRRAVPHRDTRPGRYATSRARVLVQEGVGPRDHPRAARRPRHGDAAGRGAARRSTRRRRSASSRRCRGADAARRFGPIETPSRSH